MKLREATADDVERILSADCLKLCIEIDALKSQLAEANRKLELWEWAVRGQVRVVPPTSGDRMWDAQSYRHTARREDLLEAIAELRRIVEDKGEA